VSEKQESALARLWTNQILDDARAAGDPVADAVVSELFREGEVDAVNSLMRTLVLNDGLPPHLLPPVVLEYLARPRPAPTIDPLRRRLAEETFGVLGPEVLAVLGFYSLPADYAAKKGVQVLYRTGRLSHRPVRRVFETTQMVVDVMAPGGLGDEGRGVRSAEKVRLMHAAIRHLILNTPQNPWDPAFGTPINQEDLVGTLMSFSLLVLDGLERLGVELEPANRAAYFDSWMAVGPLLGIDDELIPSSLEEGRALTGLIHQRQIAGSPEGVELARALIEGYQSLLPAPLRGTPASLIHFFLDHDPFTGQNIAALLGVPPANWTSVVAELLLDIDHFFGRHAIGHSLCDRAISYVSRHLIEGMLLLERGGQRAPFSIPDELQTRWGVGAAASGT
jgi:hypothetical protein